MALLTLLIVISVIPSKTYAEERQDLEEVVNTGKDNGYFEQNSFVANDPHYGWKLSSFSTTGYTRVTQNENDMEWGKPTYWNLINLILSVLAILAAVGIGVYTVRKQQQYALEHTHSSSYENFPVEIIQYSENYVSNSLKLHTHGDSFLKKAKYLKKAKKNEAEQNTILDTLKSCGSPTIADMSNVMKEIRYEFCLNVTNKLAVAKMLAIAYIISAQMRSEKTSAAVSAKGIVKNERMEMYLKNDEIIKAIDELCRTKKFPRKLRK